MSRARETLLRSQHVGKMFLLLPSAGRNDFPSGSPFVTITFASATSFIGYIDVRRTWMGKQGSCLSRNGKCGEMPGAVADVETKLEAGGSCTHP